MSPEIDDTGRPSWLPAASVGAALEVEFRRRARAVHGHAELLDYLETLAAHRGPAFSSSELAALAAHTFSAELPQIRQRLRLAAICLFGSRPMTEHHPTKETTP